MLSKIFFDLRDRVRTVVKNGGRQNSISLALLQYLQQRRKGSRPAGSYDRNIDRLGNGTGQFNSIS